MSHYIADKKYNGTLERSLALILDYHLVSGIPGHPDHVRLRWDSDRLVEDLASTLRARLEEKGTL